MSPSVAEEVVREVPLLEQDQDLASAVREILAAEVPALPVIDEAKKLVGIFGEREFVAALFPGYLGELKYAGFVPDTLDEALEQRSECRKDPVSRYMNTEHVEADAHVSAAHLAETFLHHRVLIVPIVEAGEVRGVVTRSDFFAAVATRFLG